MNFAVTVQVRCQDGADAEKLEVHADGEIVRAYLVHIIGVRIVNVRQRGKINLQHILVVPFLEHAKVSMVAPREQINDFLGVGLLPGLNGRWRRVGRVVGWGGFSQQHS